MKWSGVKLGGRGEAKTKEREKERKRGVLLQEGRIAELGKGKERDQRKHETSLWCRLGTTAEPPLPLFLSFSHSLTPSLCSFFAPPIGSLSRSLFLTLHGRCCCRDIPQYASSFSAIPSLVRFSASSSSFTTKLL